VKNAEVGEYEGSRQLQPVEAVTDVETIQSGVGFTEGESPDDGQSTVSNAATDGGTKADERSAEGWEPDEDAEGVSASAHRVVATLVSSDTDAMSRDDLCKATAGRYPAQGYDASELENAIDVAISEEGWLVEDENGVRQP